MVKEDKRMPSYVTGYTKLALGMFSTEEKAREYGAPVVYVNPKNTSRLCPVHGALIVYDNSSRIGKCSVRGELWHRDVVACLNLLLRARLGNGSTAPSLGELGVDGRSIPFSSTAAHDPTGIPKSLWARWKTLPQKHYATDLNRVKR